MSMRDPFEVPKQSIDWARAAIDDLDRSAAEFFGSRDHIKIITEVEADSGDYVQKLRLLKRPPQTFSRKATEALTNLRHAFDQATYAACLALGNPAKNANYPWAQTVRDLEILLSKRKIDARLHDVFARHEPYPRSDADGRGDSFIRSLAVFANVKHTVGISPVGHISHLSYPRILGGRVEKLIVPSPNWDPAKNEAELVRWRGDVKVQGDYQISFQIVFRDAIFPQPVEVKSALLRFAQKAEDVVNSLEARCKEILS